jgi:hypothetical protein
MSATKKTPLTNYLLELLTPVLKKDEFNKVSDLLLENQKSLQKSLTNIKAGKKKKDPDAPKRGKSSYIFFCIENRDIIKNKNSEMDAKEITKELGRVWKNDLSEKEKQHYIDLSEKDTKRYKKEMLTYSPSELYSKKPSGPKKSLTSYIFFCKEHRSVLKEEQPDLSAKDITSELGKLWRNMSDSDKEPYTKLALKDKSRYEEEKSSSASSSSSSSSLPEEESPKKDSSKKKEPKDKVKKEPKDKVKKESSKKKEPKDDKVKKTGYIIFCQKNRQELKDNNKDWNSKQITKELGEMWSKLSKDEQKKYK